jgi:HD-like signal output (HDOD) protein
MDDPYANIAIVCTSFKNLCFTRIKVTPITYALRKEWIFKKLIVNSPIFGENLKKQKRKKNAVLLAQIIKNLNCLSSIKIL